MSQKEAIAKAPEGRVTRVPVGTRNKLTVKGKDPNYEYRVVNDTEDRISQFLDAGYEIVEDKAATVGDRRASEASVLGSKKVFSVGQGVKGVLMRIRKEWYQEDQQKKQQFVDAQEASIIKKATDGNYGKIELNRD